LLVPPKELCEIPSSMRASDAYLGQRDHRNCDIRYGRAKTRMTTNFVERNDLVAAL